ncbi:MAG: aspartate kinase [Candidatus Cyclobacteriaceae bacterium M3_2C_046]
MKVLKFGGTSVGKPDRMKNVANIVTVSEGQNLVVLSALSGTTNSLVEIGECLRKKEAEKARQLIEQLYQHYLGFYQDLLHQPDSLDQARQIIESHFNFIFSLVGADFSQKLEKELLAQGELMSTKLFLTYLREKGFSAILIEAFDFMRIDQYADPDVDYLRNRLGHMLQEQNQYDIYITQGYICKNHEGETDNLKRGGSDYSATLIGAAIQAEEVQIWTDIDGMHNNDPRVVDKTYPIAELSFNEASELAYFGAKILHPSSIWPVQHYNVPVRLLNTMNPQASGTFINQEEKTADVKAIAAKDGITAIKIKSSRMLMAYGFLRKIFEVFEKYRTPIDMITTSEVAVSLTIDDDRALDQITQELAPFGTVHIDRDQTIVCIVGNLVVQRKGIVKKVFESLENIPIRMISYGGSKYNISLLIDSNHKKDVLMNLNEALFIL